MHVGSGRLGVLPILFSSQLFQESLDGNKKSWMRLLAQLPMYHRYSLGILGVFNSSFCHYFVMGLSGGSGWISNEGCEEPVEILFTGLTDFQLLKHVSGSYVDLPYEKAARI